MSGYDFPVTRTEDPKSKPDQNNLGFGEYFTDHMFLMDYDESGGWRCGRIVPYAPLAVDPAAAVFHYAQEAFEGLKAYSMPDGGIALFRPYENARRSNISSARLCIPSIDEELYVEAIRALVKTDADWVPKAEGTSLYIRPFIIATEAFMGLRPAKKYIFCIILSPVGSYYKEGLKPTRIFVEDEYVRSAPGGTGFAKTGGNYAASLLSLEKARRQGCAQVLWLDGAERKYVEEIGTSNAFFVKDGTVFTPPLTGTILPGITRGSVIELLKSWGIDTVESKFTIEEIFEAHRQGRLSEVFATGTAAVISPVGEILWKGDSIAINSKETGPVALKLYEAITGIQSGKAEDLFSWTLSV